MKAIYKYFALTPKLQIQATVVHHLTTWLFQIKSII